ncbi:MAG: HNH endonuclease signature motif containing protein, partial [Acidimicrobiia bacterium]|nr:HNH endonuclease signature motif containing protein [Acidimicrobiia bacterium]
VCHTRPYAQGGPTTIDNLAPLCRHDHRLKHDGGWQLDQTEPGHYAWFSPPGHTYSTNPQPP